ncbi:DNA (cytosine-5-)-methyltransferase [Litoribacter ruber]|uniref:DNA cytosine methyltransferase n=1 Tax=Litoribacter ruber TaxID=702568 RepID=UPI001BD92E4E|nr:DNA (cytosine-5-)-methyltransferase [Litoribacter ruber]MBT0812369.1 DNA (cytosine-5-)-methyltransferase [Litoribacter ruber]
MVNYSDIKNKYKIEVKKTAQSELAYLTHFLHAESKIENEGYKAKVKKYVNEGLIQESILEEPYFQQKLNLNWDVPFPPVKSDFTFIDLFAGIGGFRIALQKLGGRCVFSSEIDKAAQQTYEANFGEVPFGDIKEFTSYEISDLEIDQMIPDHDLLAAGFPCQPFSLAGVSARNFLGMSHGFHDQDQGNLFFDILRIVKVKRPKVLFLENVRNLKSHDNGKTFSTIEMMIKELGYSFDWKIINSESLVPQRRVRTYMVCFLNQKINFEFPEISGDPLPLKNILEEKVPETFTISDKLWQGHQNRSRRNKERGTGFTVKLADLEKPSNTIVARYYKDGKECLIPQENSNPRKLTPRECARLQGFPEEFILHPSNSSAYKQFGNSVAIPVIFKIGKNIQKFLVKE